MSIILAGITLPDPVECIPGIVAVGTPQTMCDGTPDYAFAGAKPVKANWRIKWSELTYQEYRLVCEAYTIALQNATLWTPPVDGAAYMARALTDFAPAPAQGYLRLACGFTLQEV